MRSIDGDFEFTVLVHGREVMEYPHNGMVFIEGRRGSEYTLRVRNHTGTRVLAVPSVDGLSVITGQPASHADGGYIIGPYSHVDIPGWRLNDLDVAHFFFGSLPEAYASQMGRPENIGVLGAIFFRERRRPEPLKAEVAPPTREASRSFHGQFLGGGVGTGFGRRTEHQVSRAYFDREGYPADEFTIRYETAEELRRRGIEVTTAHFVGDRVVEAVPFPADRLVGAGATPPPGWRG